MSAAARLGLGTVQWGLDYGIANAHGRPDVSSVLRMLDFARQAGIDVIDTASAYGAAEDVLGETGAAARGFRIVSKTAIAQGKDARLITASFHESLAKLRCEQIDVLLVHRGGSLLEAGGEEVWTALAAIRDAGHVLRIGVSVYTPAELTALLDRFDIEAVQLPYSIFDQRFAHAGLLDRLKDADIEVHARSAFLQGILLMSSDKLPPHFSSIVERHRDLHALFSTSGVTALQGALRFCLDDMRLTRVIIGCETLDQLVEIVSAAEAAPRGCESLARFAIDDVAITLPTNWPATRA